MKPNSSLNTGPEPPESALCEPDQGIFFPPYSTDSLSPGRTSPLSEALDLMQSLIISKEQRPNYAQPGRGADGGKFYVPPTTHFIAIVEDLTDMLDYASEDIEAWTTMPETTKAKTRRLPDVGGHL